MQPTTQPPDRQAAQSPGCPAPQPLICLSSSPQPRGCLAAWLSGRLTAWPPVQPAAWASDASQPAVICLSSRLPCYLAWRSHSPIVPHRPSRQKGKSVLPRLQENSEQGPCLSDQPRSTKLEPLLGTFFALNTIMSTLLLETADGLNNYASGREIARAVWVPI